MKVVGLCRLSPTGADEEERKRKLEKQKTKIREHCDEADKELVEMFVAPRASARKYAPIERETFQEMLTFIIEHPDIQEIVVHHFDRITRQGVTRLSLLEHIRAGLWQPGSEVREIDVYSTSHEKYAQSYTNLDDVSAGDIFGAMAEGYQSQKSKKDEADKTEEVVNDRQRDFHPHGKPTMGINSNRVVLDHEDSLYYVPDDEEEFRMAIRILSDHEIWDGSDYELGKKHGIESNPGNKVGTIVRNKWKYFQAYHACLVEELDTPDVGDLDVDLQIEELTEEVLAPLPSS